MELKNDNKIYTFFDNYKLFYILWDIIKFI